MVFQIGQSLFDAPGAEKVAALIEKAKQRNIKIVFPVDYVTADKFDKDAKVRSCRNLSGGPCAHTGIDWPCHGR